MKMDSLHELYVDELKDLLSAEKQLSKALPKMAKAATNEQLSQAFETHAEETLEHITRLEGILEELDELGRGKKCKGMEGLIEEGKEMMEEDADEDVLDAGLISKAQHIEHYEIAGYGTVRAYAELLGRTEDMEILARTLEEEKKTDVHLTELAMGGGINIEANDGQTGADGSEEEEDESESRSGGSRGGKSSGGSRSGSSGGSKSGSNGGSRGSSGGSRGSSVGSRGGSKSGGSRSGASGSGSRSGGSSGSRSGSAVGRSGSGGGGGAYRSTSGRSR